ncbi:MAG: GNAT family N-acetyltransferase [Candidatus Thorarchaeota archaeon]
MSELYQLKQLQEDQIEAASQVLSRAFQNDPLLIYLCPDPIERKIKCVKHCEWLILIGFVSGEVYTTSDEIEGVAIWHPHTIDYKKWIKQSKEIIKKMRKVRKEIFSDAFYSERLMIVEEIANSFQNEHVNFPHWYLAFIGVDPLHQGKGFGNKLIKAKLAEIDKHNLTCYLHTENERNVEFYKHLGFELIGKNKIPHSEIYHYPMLRNKKK